MKYIIIRHGKTGGNEEGRYLPPDEHLSEEGIRELKKKRDAGLFRELESIPLFISPHIRCRETAELLFPGIPYHRIDELREIDFGRFTGKNYAELNGAEEYQRWIDSNGELPFPEGESKDEYIRRVNEGLQRIREILDNAEKPSENQSDTGDEKSKTAVIIAHAGTIMAAHFLINKKGYFDLFPDFGEVYSFSEN